MQPRVGGGLRPDRSSVYVLLQGNSNIHKVVLQLPTNSLFLLNYKRYRHAVAAGKLLQTQE